ncbi:MAG: DUF2075 domain-containing protein [Lachnospiraceae bacterium]|nr:DUF2075 domain-containing protein [Lachnospiraceae bacterium]
MSSSIAGPVIRQIRDNRESLDYFENVSLSEEDEKTQEIIRNFPTVYIHNWMESGAYEVYVGESNDIFKRTRQHYDVSGNKEAWQSKNEKAVRNRTLSDGKKEKFGAELIRHEVRVLMTRGVNGMYIYACDPELRAALMRASE